MEINKFLQAQGIKEEMDKVENILLSLSNCESVAYITFKDKSRIEMFNSIYPSNLDDIKLDTDVVNIIVKHYKEKLETLRAKFSEI